MDRARWDRPRIRICTSRWVAGKGGGGNQCGEYHAEGKFAADLFQHGVSPLVAQAALKQDYEQDP